MLEYHITTHLREGKPVFGKEAFIIVAKSRECLIIFCGFESIHTFVCVWT